MGYFARAQERRTFTLKDGNSFTAKKLTYVERSTIIDKSGRLNALTQEFLIDTGRLKLEQLAARLVGWEGEGFEGHPCDRENILALPPEIADEMSELLDEWDSPLSDAEKKPSA